MKYKPILIKFLEEKNRLVRKHTKLKLISVADFREIEGDNWTESDCQWALMKLHPKDDSALCPWCAMFLCGSCGYGKRNGICSYYAINSRYSRVLRRLGQKDGISKIPGMKELVNKYIKEVRGNE